MLHACRSQAKCSVCLMQMWKGLEGDAKEALRQAAQQLSSVEQAQQEAARLRWTADTAQRYSFHTDAKMQLTFQSDTAERQTTTE